MLCQLNYFSCMQATCYTCRLLGLLVHSCVPLVATSSVANNQPKYVIKKEKKKKTWGRCKKIGMEQKQKQKQQKIKKKEKKRKEKK